MAKLITFTGSGGNRISFRVSSILAIEDKSKTSAAAYGTLVYLSDDNEGPFLIRESYGQAYIELETVLKPLAEENEDG